MHRLTRRSLLASAIGLTFGASASPLTRASQATPPAGTWPVPTWPTASPNELGFDPALTAGPFETALQDVLGITIFLSLATALLHWLT